MDPLDCSLDELAKRDKQSRRNHGNRKRREPEHDSDFAQRIERKHDSRKRMKDQNYGQPHSHHQSQSHGHRRQYDDYKPRNRNDSRNRNQHHYNHHRSHDNRSSSNWRRKERVPATNHNDRADNRMEATPLPRPPNDKYYREVENKTVDADETAPSSAKYAYVTLIMRGDAYIPGALILAHSLRLRHSQHALICMVTDDVSDRAQQALKLLYDHVVLVPYLTYDCKRMKTDKQQEKYQDWSTASFTKWNILQLSHLLGIAFDRLLFLDADKIVLQNIDHLLADHSLQCPAGTFSSPWTSNNNGKHNRSSSNGRSNSGLIDYYPAHMKHGDEVPAKCIYDALYKNGFVAVGTGMLFEPSLDEYRKFVAMLDVRWISDEYLENNMDYEKMKLRRLNRKFMVQTDVPSNCAETVKTDEARDEEVPKAVAPEVVEEAAVVSEDFPETETAPAKEEEVKQVVNVAADVDDDADHDHDHDPWRKLIAQEKNNNRSIGFQNCYSMLDEQSIVFFYYYHQRAWHFIDTKYNFIPWHFKWMEKEDGALDIPAVLHFFGMKPWIQSPLEWRDLQVWWALVYHLITHASTETYEWTEPQSTLVASFFDQKLLKELPLELYDDAAANDDGNDGKDKNASESDDANEQKRKSRVTCFWCYEMAKRDGLKPQTLIDENRFDEIESIFHFPVDPKSGQLCCPKLLPLNEVEPVVDSENGKDEVHQPEEKQSTCIEVNETAQDLETDF